MLNGQSKPSLILCVKLLLQMKLLTVAFVSLLTKTCTGHQGGGGKFGQKLHFFGTISSLKIGVLLGKYFRKQTNS